VPSLVAAAPDPAALRRPVRAVLGVGGAATGATLVAAAILESMAVSTFDQLRNTCAPHCAQQDVLPMQRQQDAATGLFIASGVAAFTTAVTLLVLHYRH
jgi:hypothetical protein